MKKEAVHQRLPQTVENLSQNSLFNQIRRRVRRIWFFSEFIRRKNSTSSQDCARKT